MLLWWNPSICCPAAHWPPLMTSEMPLLKTRRAAIYCGEGNNTSAFERGKWWRRKRRRGKPNETKQRGVVGMRPSGRGSLPQQQEAPLKERRFRKEKKCFALLWLRCLKKGKKKKKNLLVRLSVRDPLWLVGARRG